MSFFGLSAVFSKPKAFFRETDCHIFRALSLSAGEVEAKDYGATEHAKNVRLHFL